MNTLSYISTLAMPFMILLIIGYGLISRTGVYDCFIEGAKEGVDTSVRIIPPILGLMIGIAMLRSSGILDYIGMLISPVTKLIGMDENLLPLALLRPVSGSGSLGIFTDLINRFGADSLIGRTASVMSGSTETTFYTLTVYFGAISIKNTRHALPCAIFADIVSIVTSVIVCRLWFT